MTNSFLRLRSSSWSWISLPFLKGLTSICDQEGSYFSSINNMLLAEDFLAGVVILELKEAKTLRLFCLFVFREFEVAHLSEQ